MFSLLTMLTLSACAGGISRAHAETTAQAFNSVQSQTAIPQTGYTTAVPAAYQAASAQPGTVTRLDYESRDYVRDSAPIIKTAYVYTPYGYDENDTETRYNILYLMHGWGGRAGEYFSYTETKNGSDVKDALPGHFSAVAELRQYPCLTDEQNREVSKYLHTLSDLERISDHARNIAESGAELHEKGLVLSEPATQDLSVLLGAVSEVVDTAIAAFTTSDLQLAKQVEPLEQVIDNLSDDMKVRQIERLQQKKVNIPQNFIFNDLITNFERVSDHCSNIALTVLRLQSGDFDTHDYQERLLAGEDEEFKAAFQRYNKEYTLE